jgi:penicillin-insensitive murein endopeptidase
MCSFFALVSCIVGVVRVLAVVLALAAASAGCAELGVVTDGSSISYGRPARGRLIDGVKLPDSGPGFTTAPVWRERGNRYGTDELVTLLKSVSRRMKKKAKDTRLVVADLSGTGGGAAHQFHKSHQSGRDVDLLYFVRDAQGNPFEPSAMHVFNGRLVAADGSGITLDVPRTWQLVKELLTAQEAYVQYIFMYRPIAEKLIEHAQKSGEPEVVVARAMKTLKQPGDSAPHNDHMHVRIYCSMGDRMFGCVDIGPLEMLAEREMEAQQTVATIAAALPPSSDTQVADGEVPQRTAADVWNEASAKASSSVMATSVTASDSFSSLLRASSHRIDLRGWR